LNNVEKYFFSIADGSKVFVFVVFGDGGLVNENVFVGVVSVDETVAVSNVEPLDDSGDRGGDDGFFSGGWRVSSGLVVLGLSFDLSGWFFLDGLFGNFGSHDCNICLLRLVVSLILSTIWSLSKEVDFFKIFRLNLLLLYCLITRR